MVVKSSNSHVPRLTYNSARKVEAKLWPIRPIENDIASEEGILQNNNRNNNEIQVGSEARIVKKVDITDTF